MFHLLDRVLNNDKPRTRSPDSYSDTSSWLNTPLNEPDVDTYNKQEQLHQSARDRPSTRPRSRYTHVDVLLLRWADDDLGVGEEIEKLDELLRFRFNFSTRPWCIPRNNSQEELMKEILRFTMNKMPGDLLILYYGGHADDSELQTCVWAANQTTNSPTLNWHNIQSWLMGSPADVLLVLDCCFAGLAPQSAQIGENWFLGASTRNSGAGGVSYKSFTSALTRELDRRASAYWEDSKTFTVQDVQSALELYERNLFYSVPLIRLTDRECKPTELTPLLPNRGPNKLQTVNSFPQAQAPQEAGRPSVPIRPRVTLPYTDSAIPQEREFTDVVLDQRSADDMSIGEFRTVRISGLPATTTEQDLRQWLEARLKSKAAILRIGPMVTISAATTSTVTFSSVETANQALAMRGKHFPARTGGQTKRIEIETQFRGLTYLYVPKTSPPTPPNADLVFVHGARGHAINRFACHYTNAQREALWPCEDLPKLLEAGGINPRVMTFGWNADAWLNPQKSILAECESFVTALRRERSGISERPLIFIGHGVGGLLVKQAVIEITNSGFGERGFENPIKACFFFAVPHHAPGQNSGSAADIDFASLLATMSVALDVGGSEKSTLTQLLKPRNRKFSNLSSEFDEVRRGHSVDTISFYEELKTGGYILVPRHSAVLDDSPGKGYGIHANYRDIVRLSKSEQDLRVVLDLMCESIRVQLGLASPRIPNDPEGLKETPNRNDKRLEKPNKERVYARLKQYDTLFLVDDSGSMDGPRWKTTAHILAEIAGIAVEYDKNGVDVRFFNNYLEDEERLNLISADGVMNLFSKVQPDGPTLTADILDEELTEYMFEFRKDRRKKGLNVIILTDGEPTRGQDVEAVIVKYARQLEAMSAKPLHVGLQFVQIGGDEGAAKFLKSLDDDLQEKYQLDRDVCMVPYWYVQTNDHIDGRYCLLGQR